MTCTRLNPEPPITLPSGFNIEVTRGGDYLTIKLNDANGNTKYGIYFEPSYLRYYVDGVMKWSK